MDGVVMREILFKAKRKNWRNLPKEEWWVEGDLIHEPFGTVIQYYADGKRVKVIIDPETLCQYIEMNDKNGSRIWENDFISISTYSCMEPQEDFFGKVVYAYSWGCWCIQQPNAEKPIPLCECEGSYQTDIFVEGNIFDNPETMIQA